ncbi:doublecortin domain-containing protein 2B isoform X2 [Chroicocephalus ridibundus]|uniref:doublecortin domain-containing protein 2B isoform X2 n=1 Tax=Chroicocephalus ridibundus TaxID=1192867 RepID=UPI002FDEA75E
MSPRGLALAPPAKNVVVYRNGDPFFPGRKFVVNQRRFLTFEAFLNEVTKSIHAPLAVRNLYTPRHGRRVTELGDLQDGCQYVAAGFEKFKRLNYLNPGRKELRGTRNSQGLQFRTVAPWKSNVLAPWQKRTHLPCTIHVFRNGDLLSPPFPLLLSKSTPLQWDALLATLTEKADLRSGAVNKLCRLDGTQVSGGEELVNGDYYVAVGNEEYKKLPYFELLVPQDSAYKTLWNHLNSRRKKYHRRFGELCATSQVSAGDSAFPEPPQQKACQKCVMNTFSWTVAGCRPQELQRKARSQLLFHNCRGKPGNLALKRKSPFSMLNLPVQDKTGEGATGMHSTGVIKVEDAAKKASIKPEILGLRCEVLRK